MNQDPNEVYAGNKAINAELHEMLDSPLFSKDSRRRMQKKIREARGVCQQYGTEEADAGARHTFREFVLARQLNAEGFRLEYGENICGQTPDWYDAPNKLLLEVFTCERGGKSELKSRLAAGIEKKINKYETIVQQNNLSFIVAVYGDFMTGLDADDCKDAIDDARLFRRCPILSGVLFFSESTVTMVPSKDGSTDKRQEYGFQYFANPSASRSFQPAADLNSTY